MHTVSSTKTCETCGSSLDVDAPSGFCVACLLGTALEDAADIREPAPGGSRIDDYEIINEIARGGMGIVYRARQRTPSRVVALKMVLPSHINSPEALARFRGETEAAASLDHESILPIYAVGEENGIPFYSMKFAEGGSLAARLSDFRNKPRESALLIAKLARAVAHAHEHGILHRDLKPGNVLFDAAGKPFVSDFGLAKWLERECDLTQTLAILGTPFYMAPEQSADARSITAAADIYSLGAILFHLLTGRPPFRGGNAMEVLRNAAERPAPRPRALDRKIPPDLETICLKCLEKNPAARYPSAIALADDLDRFLAQRAILARRANPLTHAARWVRRNPSITLLGAASVALLVSLLLVLRPAPKEMDMGKSIAVLPFENLSDDPANAYFADGIQDDVLTNLAKVADLKVISRRSVMQYRGKARNPHEIGQALKVAHILEGSIRRTGGRVRVNAQLIDTRTDAQIWGEQYDRELADVFSIQSELAERIVARLQATLSPVEKAAIEAPPTRDLQAYDLYLRAKEVIFQLPSATFEADITKAIDLLNQAVARDPKFALAYALLCRAHVDFFWESGRAPAQLEQARLSAEAASRLAPDSGETRFARGFYFFHGLEDNPRALAEFTIAMRQLPNNAEVFTWSGILERRMALWTEAVRDLEKAMELDPHNPLPPFDLSVTYEMLRNYAEAQQTIDRALIAIPQRTNPLRARKAEIALLAADSKTCRSILQSLPADYQQGGFIPYLWARLALWNRDYVEADRVLAAVPLKDASTFTKAWIARDQAFVAHAAGDAAAMQAAMCSARTAWEAQLQEAGDKTESLSYLALWDAAMGDKQSALKEAEQAVELRPLARDASNAPDLLLRQALVYAWCGERDLAFRQLAMLAKIPGGFSAGEIKLNPAWDCLRNDSRFQELLKQSGPLAAPLTPTELLPATSEPNTDAERKSSKSVAVLPFDNLGDDKTNAYFASGIHDDLLVNLSKIRDLKVIARESVLPYKGSARNLPEIGKTLGVTAVVQGSVRRAGTRARVNVQLLDAATGGEIWADNFDREITDVFAIQSDLALQVASALKATLSPMESAGIKRQPTENAQAYLLYVRANDLFAGHMKARPDLEKAEKLFQEAVGLDPKFALAFAQLSQLETIFSGYDPTPARVEKARVTAEEALRLQPDLPEAHMAMGRYYWQGQKHHGEMDLAGALREFQTAERGLPGSAEIKGLIARVERQQGKWMASLAGLEKAAALDPNTADRWHRIYYGNLALRRYPEAAKALDRAIALSPNSWLFELHRAWLQVQWKGDVSALERLRPPAGPRDDPYTDWIRTKIFLGRYDEAEKVVRDDPRPEIPWNGLPAVPKSLLLGNINFAKKDRAKAREYYEAALPTIVRAVQDAPLDADRHMVLADVYAGLDRKEEAIREGERACELLPESEDAWFGVWMADDLADLYVKVGEPELALTLLGHSLSVPAGKQIERLRIDPLWEPLRSNPRFQKLLDSPPVQNAGDETIAENKSIAVLPFENLSDNRANEYFASGIHDDLLANLAKLGQLKVISHNSVLSYKKGPRNLREIGRALGVRTVLEGTVQRADNRAHINVQLIDTTNDAQIWAESFDRDVTDIFSVQSDLAARIAGALQVKLSPAERAAIERPPTHDAEAYDFYLRGRELLDGIASLGNREENLSNAIDLLNRAVARDPDFALGYCFLAQLHLARFRLPGNNPTRLDPVKSNLELALRLSPDLGEAHLVKGMYFYHGVVDYSSASAEFAIARGALPNSSECFHLSGLLARRLGRWSDGLDNLRKAVSLDPKNATAREDLASTYYLTRNFAAADQIFDEAIVALPEHENFFRLKKAQVALIKGDLEGCRAGLQSLPPDYEYDGFVAYHRAQLALYLRDFAEANRILSETLAKLGRKKTEWWVVRDQAFVARAEGNAAKAKAAFQTALQFWESDMRRKKPDDPGVLCTLAEFHAGLGQKEEALREAHRAGQLRPIAADAVDGPAFATNEALVHAWCGERDLALKQLASLAKLPSGPDPGDLKFDPRWDVLRGDPRFDESLASAAEPIKVE